MLATAGRAPINQAVRPSASPASEVRSSSAEHYTSWRDSPLCSASFRGDPAPGISEPRALAGESAAVAPASALHGSDLLGMAADFGRTSGLIAMFVGGLQRIFKYLYSSNR